MIFVCFLLIVFIHVVGVRMGGIAWKGNIISFFFSVFGALNQSMQAKHLFSFPHKQKHVGVYSEGFFFFFFFLSNFKK
jgi:hypothetical protein